MAHNPDIETMLRADLGARPFIAKRMFGGIAFMLHGHMVCGALNDSALYRVGKPHMSEALTLAGVGPMRMGERTMGGYADASLDALEDDQTRAALMALALGFTATLPPK